MPESRSTARTEPAAIDPYHLVEIKEVFERTRYYSNLRIQIATFFGTIDLTILGLAFSLQKAGLFFAAAGTLLLWIVSDTYARRELRPFYFRGLQLEKLYAPEGAQALLHTYLAAVKSRRDLVPWLEEIAALDAQSERVRSMRQVRPQFGGMWWAFLVAVAVEIGLGLVFWLVAGWSFG